MNENQNKWRKNSENVNAELEREDNFTLLRSGND